MTEISARKWVENDRTDIKHVLGLSKSSEIQKIKSKSSEIPTIKSESSEIPKIRSLLKYTVGNLVKIWPEMGRRGSVWAENGWK